MPEEFLTRSEAELIVESGRDRTIAAGDAHEQIHEHERMARELRATKSEARWVAHSREHDLMAVLASERTASHEREHEVHSVAHDREHQQAAQALAKAEQATDTRFAGVNEFREQLRDQAATFASSERVDGIQKDVDRRLEELRTAVVNIEKLDSKGEGRQLGQGAVVAAIVGAVGFAATLLGLIIVIANIVTK